MRTLFFDLETAPNYPAVTAYLEANPFDPADVKLGNLKDKEKIKAKIEAARSSYSENILDKAALNPALCRIVCIQTAIDCGTPLVNHFDNEEDMIATFFKAAQSCNLWVNWTGNNTRSNFDLKMLYRRGWATGAGICVAPTIAQESTRDLANDFLRFDDYPTYLSLENAAGELGIAVQDTPVTGKEFWRFWEGLMTESALTVKEQRQAAMDYAIQDVRLLQAISQEMTR